MDNVHLITVVEAAATLGLCDETIYKLCHTDPDFPAVQLGRKWFIVADQLPDYFALKLANRKQD